MKDYFIYLKGSVATSTRLAYLEDIHFFCVYLTETKDVTSADKPFDITLDDFKKTVSEYLAWEVTNILKNSNSDEDERLGK